MFADLDEDNLPPSGEATPPNEEVHAAASNTDTVLTVNKYGCPGGYPEDVAASAIAECEAELRLAEREDNRDKQEYFGYLGRAYAALVRVADDPAVQRKFAWLKAKAHAAAKEELLKPVKDPDAAGTYDAAKDAENAYQHYGKCLVFSYWFPSWTWWQCERDLASWEESGWKPEDLPVEVMQHLHLTSMWDGNPDIGGDLIQHTNKRYVKLAKRLKKPAEEAVLAFKLPPPPTEHEKKHMYERLHFEAKYRLMKARKEPTPTGDDLWRYASYIGAAYRSALMAQHAGVPGAAETVTEIVEQTRQDALELPPGVEQAKGKCALGHALVFRDDLPSIAGAETHTCADCSNVDKDQNGWSHCTECDIHYCPGCHQKRFVGRFISAVDALGAGTWEPPTQPQGIAQHLGYCLLIGARHPQWPEWQLSRDMEAYATQEKIVYCPIVHAFHMQLCYMADPDGAQDTVVEVHKEWIKAAAICGDIAKAAAEKVTLTTELEPAERARLFANLALEVKNRVTTACRADYPPNMLWRYSAHAGLAERAMILLDGAGMDPHGTVPRYRAELQEMLKKDLTTSSKHQKYVKDINTGTYDAPLRVQGQLQRIGYKMVMAKYPMWAAWQFARDMPSYTDNKVRYDRAIHQLHLQSLYESGPGEETEELVLKVHKLYVECAEKKGAKTKAIAESVPIPPVPTPEERRLLYEGLKVEAQTRMESLSGYYSDHWRFANDVGCAYIALAQAIEGGVPCGSMMEDLLGQVRKGATQRFTTYCHDSASGTWPPVSNLYCFVGNVLVVSEIHPDFGHGQLYRGLEDLASGTGYHIPYRKCYHELHLQCLWRADPVGAGELVADVHKRYLAAAEKAGPLHKAKADTVVPPKKPDAATTDKYFATIKKCLEQRIKFTKDKNYDNNNYGRYLLFIGGLHVFFRRLKDAGKAGEVKLLEQQFEDLLKKDAADNSRIAAYRCDTGTTGTWAMEGPHKYLQGIGLALSTRNVLGTPWTAMQFYRWMPKLLDDSIIYDQDVHRWHLRTLWWMDPVAARPTAPLLHKIYVDAAKKLGPEATAIAEKMQVVPEPSEMAELLLRIPACAKTHFETLKKQAYGADKYWRYGTAIANAMQAHYTMLNNGVVPEEEHFIKEVLLQVAGDIKQGGRHEKMMEALKKDDDKADLFPRFLRFAGEGIMAVMAYEHEWGLNHVEVALQEAEKHKDEWPYLSFVHRAHLWVLKMAREKGVVADEAMTVEAVHARYVALTLDDATRKIAEAITADFGVDEIVFMPPPPEISQDPKESAAAAAP